MANKHAQEIDSLITKIKEGRTRIIQQCAGKAVTFFKKSFRDEGFTDQGLVKWESSKGGAKRAGQNTLTNKGVLKRAIRIMRADANGALISVDNAVKYAEIHNTGGEIPITPKMRRFFWAMFYKAGGGVKGMAEEDVPEPAKMWRAMALTKEDHITIPQRQFIGESRILEQNLRDYIEKELTLLLNPK